MKMESDSKSLTCHSSLWSQRWCNWRGPASTAGRYTRQAIHQFTFILVSSCAYTMGHASIAANAHDNCSHVMLASVAPGPLLPQPSSFSAIRDCACRNHHPIPCDHHGPRRQHPDLSSHPFRHIFLMATSTPRTRTCCPRSWCRLRHGLTRYHARWRFKGPSGMHPTIVRSACCRRYTAQHQNLLACFTHEHIKQSRRLRFATAHEQLHAPC